MAETKKLKKIKPDPFTFREALVHPFIPLLDKFAPQIAAFFAKHDWLTRPSWTVKASEHSQSLAKLNAPRRKSKE
jgi:hypothetical protein